MKSALLACAFAAMSVNPSMATPVTLAQYIQQDGSVQQWTVSTSASTTTVSASGAVLFSFTGVSGLPFSGPEPADFALTATSHQPGNCGVHCAVGDSLVQPGYSGSFSFVDTGLSPGSTLLAGTFAVTSSPSSTGAQFGSRIASSGGSFNASSTAGNLGQLVLTSKYLNFSGQPDQNASFSLSSLIPNFATGTVTAANQAFPVGSFNAAGAGTFSSNTPVSTVPEPETIGLIGAGFLGLLLMRRRHFSGHS